MIRVKGLGGTRSHYMAAGLFVMTGRPQPAHRRDWAQSDRLKRASGRRRQPSARLPRAPSPEAIERGDHGNATSYLVNDPVGNADQPLCVAFPCRARAMTVMLPLAAGFVVGLFFGWLLTTTVVLAAMSRSQQRMQRKVLYWQARAAGARSEAERLTHLLEAHGLLPKPGSWEEQ